MNKVILTGIIENINQVRSNQTNIILTTVHKWTDKNTGEKKEEREDNNVVFFNINSEVVNKYARVGMNILIEGFIKTGKEFLRKDGITCISKDIIARSIEFLQPIKIDGNR